MMLILGTDAGCEHATLVPRFTAPLPPRVENCDGTVNYVGLTAVCGNSPPASGH